MTEKLKRGVLVVDETTTSATIEEETSVVSGLEDKPPRSVVTCSSLASFFYEAVGDARQNQGLEATDETSYYVVSLLESFAQADLLYGVGEEGRRRDEALALLMARAMSSSSGDRINEFRRLGDMSLFISGFFSDSLRRGTVGVTYYVSMGQSAYASLSSMLRARRGKGARVYQDLYNELSETFGGWVEVLREVSATSNMSASPSDMCSGELFERWQSSGQHVSELASELLKRGLWPGNLKPTLKPG